MLNQIIITTKIVEEDIRDCGRFGIREQDILYVVGKLVPWGIRKSMLTCIKVSFERVMGLLLGSLKFPCHFFREIATLCMYSKLIS